MEDRKIMLSVGGGEKASETTATESSAEVPVDVNVTLKSKYQASAWRLWVVFFGCCVLHFMVFGMHYSFGAMFANLLEEFKAGQGQTGNFQ